MKPCSPRLATASSSPDRAAAPRPSRPARGGVRWDLVLRVRAAIARGDYETPERLRVTAERVLEALGR